MLAFKKDMEAFESLNTQVLGVSSDSMSTLEKFAEKHGIAFPLISDGDKKIKSLYSGKRINYLIDKEGTIRLIQKGIPANEYFLEKIKALER